jgi:hypothetical protein
MIDIKQVSPEVRERARLLYNEWYRNYRKQNKAKTKEILLRFWIKKAINEMNAEQNKAQV